MRCCHHKERQRVARPAAADTTEVIVAAIESQHAAAPHWHCHGPRCLIWLHKHLSDRRAVLDRCDGTRGRIVSVDPDNEPGGMDRVSMAALSHEHRQRYEPRHYPTDRQSHHESPLLADGHLAGMDVSIGGARHPCRERLSTPSQLS